MPEIIPKPKSWAAEIYELEVNQVKHFPSEDYDYLRSLCGGKVKAKHPDRIHKVNISEFYTTVQRTK